MTQRQHERRRRRPFTGRLGLVMLALLLLAGCDTAAQEQAPAVIKVGVVAPFSGDFEPLGRVVRDGLTLAAETQNQKGGVLGYPVQLVLEDSACDFQTAREATQRLIDTHEVLFVIGAVCADASEGVAQVTSEAGVLQISPASVDADFTVDAAGDLRPLVFRVPVTDPNQGTVAAMFALDRLRAEKVAILYAEDSVYGQSLAQAFRATFEAGDGEIVTTQAYDQNAELYFDVLEKVRDAEPDVIYAPGYYTVMNRLVLQARQFGLLVPVIGSDGWDAPDLDVANLPDTYYTVQYFPDDRRSDVRDWRDHYESRYLTPPNVLATLSYDAATVLFAGIAEAGVPDPILVAQAMEQMDFRLMTGDMHFDAFHNPVRPLSVLAVTPEGVRLEGAMQAPEPPPPAIVVEDEAGASDDTVGAPDG